MDTTRARKHFVLPGLLVGLVCLVGCAIYPYKKTETLSVRYDADKHVVEKMIRINKATVYWQLFGPDGGGFRTISDEYKYYVQPAHGSRTEITCFTNNGYGGFPGGYIWPVLGTTQWVVVQYDHDEIYGVTQFKEETNIDVHLTLYVFDPTNIIHQRQLTTLMPVNLARRRPPPENPDYGIPDFQFDAINQHLTYRVTNGYETYDLLQDIVSPSGAPTGKSALTSKNSWVVVRDHSQN
jgi:hypothetical protein